MMTTILAILQAVEAAPGVQDGLSSGALAFMLICMGTVVALTVWCFARILRTKEHFDPDGTGPAQAPVPGKEDRV